jgi:hypothetical protein
MDLNALTDQLRPVSLVQAITDYAALRARSAETLPLLSPVGNKALNRFFFAARLATRTKRGISFPEALANPAISAELATKGAKYTAGRDVSLVYAQFDAFRLNYGTVEQFRPCAAIGVYQRYKPSCVLDFSCGWGGRLLAAMALNINYIGIDSNTDLEPCYKAMMETYAHTNAVTLRFEPAETIDFAGFIYDMVFTSPPYYMLEKYAHMPSYESRAAFVARFLKPVVTAAWKGLAPSGYMVLNMPREIMEAVAPLLPAMLEVLPYGKRARHQNTRGGEASTQEEMYVWQKHVT